MRRLSLAMVSVAAVFAGGACGGESEPKEASEESVAVEETTSEKEQGSSDGGASADCQLEQAEADLGPAGAEELMSEWYRQEVEPRVEQKDFASALAEAKDLPTFLAERGYTC